VSPQDWDRGWAFVTLQPFVACAGAGLGALIERIVFSFKPHLFPNKKPYGFFHWLRYSVAAVVIYSLVHFLAPGRRWAR